MIYAVRTLVILVIAGLAGGCVASSTGEKPGAAAESWKDTPNRVGDPLRGGRWW